jgi:opacity protein-like surface antigen
MNFTRRQSLLTCSLLTLITTQTFATNPIPGWYGGLEFGGSLANKSTVTLYNPLFAPPNSSALSYGFGGHGGFQLGYRMNHFRLEGELDYNYNPLSKLTVNGVVIPKKNNTALISFEGNQRLISGLFNAYYDFSSNDDEMSFIPYIGLGLGYSQVQHKVNTYTAGALLPISSVDTVKTSQPVGQVIVGGNYFLDDFTSFGLDYRYMSTNTNKTNHIKTQVQSINIVFNFAFDSAS